MRCCRPRFFRSRAEPQRLIRTIDHLAHRFIPNREGIDLATSYSLLPSSTSTSGSSTPSSGNRSKRKTANVDSDAQTGTLAQDLPPRRIAFKRQTLERTDRGDLCMRTEEANKTFDSLLRTELFGPSSLDNIPLLRSPSSARTSQYTAATSPGGGGGGGIHSPSHPKALFSFTSPTRKRIARDPTVTDRGLDSPTHERYSLSPVRQESQRLLMSPRKPVRQVSKVPFKVAFTFFLSSSGSFSGRDAHIRDPTSLHDATLGKSTLLQILAGKRLTRSNAQVLGQNVFFQTPPGVTYLGQSESRRLSRSLAGCSRPLGSPRTWNWAL